MSLLLHPEYFDSIPVLGQKIKRKFENLAASTKPSDYESDGITVAIRTLNEADKLKALLKNIKQQEFNGKVEIIVIDNESSDNTVEVAKEFGAKVYTLPRSEFTYPKSMNMAVDAASHELVYLTVGHAELVSTVSLRAGAGAMHDGKAVSGVFGHALPGRIASKTEKIIAMGNLYYTHPRNIKKAGLGSMAATGSILRKSVWSELGRFDEKYERGGEDSQLAKEMLKNGYILKEEPLLSTHHTHGLGIINTIKQWLEWMRLDSPTVFDRDRLKKRRPDLDLR